MLCRSRASLKLFVILCQVIHRSPFLWIWFLEIYFVPFIEPCFSVSLCAFCFVFLFFQILRIRKISLPFILYGLLHREEDLHQSVWLEILLKPFGDGGSRRAWWRRDVTCLGLRNLRVRQVCNFFSGAPDRLGSLVFACSTAVLLCCSRKPPIFVLTGSQASKVHLLPFSTPNQARYTSPWGNPPKG